MHPEQVNANTPKFLYRAAKNASYFDFVWIMRRWFGRVACSLDFLQNRSTLSAENAEPVTGGALLVR